MSKQIIIDWQRDGLFVATGSRRGSNVSIDTLITTGGEGSTSGSSTAISTQLFALAKQFDLHKAEATVIAPREVLEFRTLSVPRGEANEVPDMVRFQAHRQMANIGDTWALDYILLPEQAGQEGISALAATISPAHMAEIEATCSDLGIHLTRVLARPLEIARWGVSAGSLASTEVSMVIALSQTHADLLLLSLGSLIQLRGTRLPEDSAAAANAIVAEIRRSVLAASSYVNNQAITKILLIAAPDMAERVEASIAQATGASVAVIDPATMLPASLPERHELAQRSANRLAAIAGVLSNPSPEKRDVIDLRNFKRREPKKSKRREYALAGGGVGVLALMGVYWWWSTNAALDSAIASARQTEKQNKELVDASSKLIKHRQDVDKFLGGSINWLDELSYVVTKLPPAEQVMLNEVTLNVGPDNSGQITLPLEAKDAQTISSVQQQLADKDHAVSGSGSIERPSKVGEYSWTAKETVRVAPKGWDPLATKPKSGAQPSAQATAQPPTATPPTATPPTATPPSATPPSATPATAAARDGEPATAPESDRAQPVVSAANGAPGAAAPEAAQPQASAPAVPPQITAPQTIAPQAATPEPAKPEPASPDAAKPDAAKPNEPAADAAPTNPPATETSPAPQPAPAAATDAAAPAK